LDGLAILSTAENVWADSTAGGRLRPILKTAWFIGVISEPTLLGDFDRDQAVSPADAQAMLQALTDLETIEPNTIFQPMTC
jgi:hypothetical protein